MSRHQGQNQTKYQNRRRILTESVEEEGPWICPQFVLLSNKIRSRRSRWSTTSWYSNEYATFLSFHVSISLGFMKEDEKSIQTTRPVSGTTRRFRSPIS